MLDINLQYLNLNFKYFSNNCENSKKSCVQYICLHMKGADILSLYWFTKEMQKFKHLSMGIVL